MIDRAGSFVFLQLRYISVEFLKFASGRIPSYKFSISKRGGISMCEICGIIGNTDNKEPVLKKMMKAIEHRGPDGSESYVAKEAALGFQRLGIIDLDTGMQPMFNEDGSKVLVFNGEIYNYWILKEMLAQKGHVFQTASDSEVLLHGYEEFGEKCFTSSVGCSDSQSGTRKGKNFLLPATFLESSLFTMRLSTERWCLLQRLKASLRIRGAGGG